jgi:two-component system alkaline phosphatase synthesis response regulator PhoP
MTRVLVIEDNPDLAFGLRNNLEIEGYTVEVATTGDAGLARAREATHDLVVLDLMLPGMDGFRVLKTLRGGGSTVPVLILTARGEEADKVRGLKLGADDYVTKPFGVLELLARIEALLRRAQGGDRDAITRFGDIGVDRATRTVTRGGRAVELPPKAYDLLVALLARRGAVAKRHELLREVWGYDAAVVSRTVDTHMAELRKKLEEDPARPRHLLTARKVGYRLAMDAQPTP